MKIERISRISKERKNNYVLTSKKNCDKNKIADELEVEDNLNYENQFNQSNLFKIENNNYILEEVEKIDINSLKPILENSITINDDEVSESEE